MDMDMTKSMLNNIITTILLILVVIQIMIFKKSHIKWTTLTQKEEDISWLL
jgi:hypothetical protein